MARVTDDIYAGAEQSQQPQVISIDGQEQITLPNADFVKNADILRDGQDLVLQTSDDQTIVIEGYFNAEPAPMLSAPSGETLTPDIVSSFVQTAGPMQYADSGSITDESPVGAVNEISGNATVTRTDGSTEPLTIGSPIYEGDIVETDTEGAVEIVFIDDTSFAVSQNAKLAIDEYVFDPATESGTQDFSVLRGLFVFTSGLVGRDDPDDVNIDTPMGSIGIRGTIIVGDTDKGEITVMEGAIVVRSLDGTEITLSEQFDTAQFDPVNQGVSYEGKIDSTSFEANFDPLKPVAGSLFSSVADGGEGNETFDSSEQNIDSGDTSEARSEDTGSEGTTDSASTDDSTTTESTNTQTTAPTAETTEGSADNTTQDGSTEATGTGDGTTTNDTQTDSTTTDSATTNDTQTDVNDTTTSGTTDTSNTSFDGSGDGTFDNTSGTFDDTGMNTDNTGATSTTTGSTSGTGDGTSSGGSTTTSGTGDTTSTSGTNSPTTTSTTTTTTTSPTVLNDPPVGTDANAGTMLASNGHTHLFANHSVANLSIGGQFTDPDGDTLTYSIIQTQQDGAATTLPFITLSGSTLQMDVPDGFTAADTQLQVTVQATDIEGNTATSIITIDVLDSDILGTSTVDGALASVAAGDVVNGLDGSDTLSLGHGSTIAFGGNGNDIINITAGTNHEIYGGTGSDTADYSGYGGLSSLSVDLSAADAVTATYTGGTDTLWYIENIVGSAGNDTITGNIDANTLDGGDGDDTIHGGAGNDTIYGGNGNDTIRGGAGDDTMQGDAGDDRFIATNGDGNDTIDGGTTGETNGDWYDASAVTSDVTVDVAAGSTSYGIQSDAVTNVERYTTGSGNDTFITTDDAYTDRTYDGGTGTDTYDASSRANTISVDMASGFVTRGANLDFVSNIERFIGGTGDDTFTGDGGNNYFDGGTGNDVFNSSAGADTFIGGGDIDEVNYSTSVAGVDIDLTDGTASGGDAAGDTLTNIENITGSGFNDTLRGDAANNELVGGGGDDTLYASGGSDVLDGGTGTDTADFSLLGAVNNITLTLNGATNASATSAKGTDTVRNIENVIGTAGNDTIVGDANANTLIGGDGADTLSGDAGADDLQGGGGDDIFVASDSDGSDIIDGGTTGETSGDSYDGSAVTLDMNINLGMNTVTYGADTDTVTNVERFFGGTGDDAFTGDAGNNYFDGGAGADNFFSDGGADTYIGGAGTDMVDYSGSGAAVDVDLGAGNASGGDAAGDSLNGIENLRGSAHDDILRGNNTGSNLIEGLAGNDTLRGSGGTDTFDGGTGNDTLDYSMFGFANAITLTLDGVNDAIMSSAKGNDTVRNIENVIGTDGADQITGDAAANTLSGGAGNDTLTEAGGNDILQGEAGDDILIIGDDGSIADGGTSSGGDTLRLTGTGAFALDETNVINIETIDAATDGSQQDIDLIIDADIVNNDSGDITITLDANDTLDLTFSGAGYSVSGGDLNSGSITYSDGGHDIIVNYSGGSAVGRITTDLPVISDLDLRSMSTTDGIYITDNINDGFGASMAVLGDINHDGYSDLAFTKTNNNPDDGRVFKVNGGAALSNVAVSGLTPDAGLLANSSSDTTGMIIAAGGDFNGDGIMDYIVANETANGPSGTPYSGNAQIIDGATQNVLAELGGISGFDAAGSAISFVGDIDGDGLDDVAVGIKNAGSGDEGATLIINGSQTALGTVDAGSPFGIAEYNNIGAGTTPQDFVVSNKGYAYVLDGTNALRIYNVNDPAAMVTAGTPTDATLSGTNKSLAIHESGDFLYALVDGNLIAIDVTSPTTPVLSPALDVGTPPSAELAVHGNTLVVVYPDADAGGTGTESGIRVFDITNPTDPLPQSGIQAITGTANANDVVLTEDYAAMISDNGLTFIDVYTSPTTPSPMGNYNFGVNRPLSVAASKDGNYTFVLDDSGTLSFIDASDPLNPSLTADVPVGTANGDITVKGSLVFVSDPSTDSIYVVDAKADGGPAIIDSIAAGIDPSSVFYHDGTLFSIGSDDILRSFDADADGSEFSSTAASAFLGSDISSAGDFNDDGFADFIVSSPGTGEVYIAYGNSSGLVNLGNTSTITGFSVDANNEIPVMSLGDVDGDGVNDIAAASTNGAGTLHVFMGDSTEVPGGSRTAGSSEVTINAVSGFEIIGASAAGDFNGDGFADMAVAMRDTSGAGDMVHVYVLYGVPAMSGTFDNSAASLGDSANAYHMTYQIQSHITPSNFELVMDSAGDVDGDGFGDLMIGVPQADTDADDDSDGEVLVVYGKEDTNNTVTTDNEAGLDADPTVGIIEATNSADALVGSDGAEALSDGGFNLVNMSAGAGNDALQINNIDIGTLNGGGGYDTLEFQLSGQTLDLTAVGSESFKNIEEISMDGSNQTVVLGLDDIFDMMETSTRLEGSNATAQIDSVDNTNIFVIEASTWNVKSGILTDNDGSTTDPAGGGEARLFDFSAGTAQTGYHSFDFGSGYELWINDTLLNTQNVVITHNAVTDNDGTDLDTNPDDLQANDHFQSLIGTVGTNILNDGGQNDISMFGFAGDDRFEINSGAFNQINGGAGTNDTIVFESDIDLTSFTPHDISQVERLEIGGFGGTTMSLTKQNILDMLESSDSGTLFIDSSNETTDTLNIDNLSGTGNQMDAGDTAIQTGLGATADSSQVGYYGYDFGVSGTLYIDQALVDATNGVNIL